MEDLNKEIEDLENKYFKFRKGVENGSNTMYLIGILTLLNLLFYLGNSELYFPVGLNAPFYTISIDQLVTLFYPILILFSGLFCVLGYYARKFKKNVFDLAILIYLIDTLITLYLVDYLGVALHSIFLLVLIGSRYSIDKSKKFKKELDERRQKKVNNNI